MLVTGSKKIIIGGMQLEKGTYNRSIVIPVFMVTFAILVISFASKVNLYSPALNVNVGDSIRVDTIFPRFLLNNISCRIVAGAEKTESYTSNIKEVNQMLEKDLPVVNNPGKMELELKLFGIIPLNNLMVNVIEPVRVIPGGQSIGVMLHSKGVMIVGMSPVLDKDGKKRIPALEAGIAVGDVILKINGWDVNSDYEVRDEVARNGNKTIIMDLLRGQKRYKVKIQPAFCSETRRYRIGLFVRDGAAGVGTLSFYHPETKSYGALGHVISDIDTAQKINLANGKVVGATVKAIHPGKRGQPGEKIGLFDGKTKLSGNIQKNTRFGIYGTMEQPVENPLYSKPLPAALSYQIKKGPAKIMTVLDGDKIEEYSIEIQEVSNRASDGKGLIIKVTDERLLKRTGGIIQGMSGSPIIQNGMFAGAVTHVFINDPTRGYGVLAEWMLQEAGILNYHKDTIKRIRQNTA